MSYKVFTIGYEKRTISEYVRLLSNSNVRILVDVRQTAWSYKQDFCKTRFSQQLNRAGILYVHVPEAGNPKEFRRCAKSIQDCLKKYRNHLAKTKSGLSELKNILSEAATRKLHVCLTCFEREVHNCHRSVIVDYLRTSLKPIEIVHL